MNKKISGVIGFGIIFVIGMILFFSATFVTKEDQYSVIKEFGKIRNVYSESGLYVKKPFIQSVTKIPKHKLIYDLPTSDIITADKKSMIVDCYAIWKVTDPTKFTQTLGASVGLAEQRLDAALYNSVKSTLSGMKQEDVIAARDTAGNIFLDNLSDSYLEYGIEVIAIDIKRLDLPDDNKQAVYARMISERNNIAAQYTAEGESEAQLIKNKADREISIMKSEAEKEAEKLIATGEAEYMKILSDSYNDESKAEFYEYVRSLDAAKKSLMNSENILILSKDSPIAQIFY